MNWETFFEIGENVTADEARQFMDSGDAERYQLLDVRQPGEYEKSHLPGAVLIPLGELPQRHEELSKEKPVIVYCRSGVRSKSGCQILNMAGYSHVFNMRGGILAWDGVDSSGSEDAGLEYFVRGDFETTYAIAYQMESGLKQFYLSLMDKAESEEEKDMLQQLARLEDGHMAKLANKHGQDIDVSKNAPLPNILEGGFDVNEMIDYFGDQLSSAELIVQLGMKLEAQAFDLYCRLARTHHGTDVAAFYRKRRKRTPAEAVEKTGRSA